ncbi:MAG: hypothetical protein KJO35_03015 [Gammaproteobacteria bacterium]|nr:hypothetical protein [Gammaproteobacteria bacterium]
MRVLIQNLAAVALLATVCSAAAESDKHRVEAAIDFSLISADSSLDSWLRGGNGKLRFGEQHDGARITRAFLEYNGRISPHWSGRVSFNANNDVAEKLDVLEAFVDWRPVPRSAWRIRSRLGIFYPRLSVENTAAGWSNRYALTNSVINSWIGEELRTVGAEVRLIHDLPRWPDQQLAFEAAIYGFNDPTGAILTWRGWSAHDRQTGITGAVPMPEISAIEPWAGVGQPGQPVPRAEPFKEIDNRPGFYVGAQWRWAKRLLVKAHHYDNHADKTATSGDDYAWKTWFDHIAVQAALPWQIGMLGQWIEGSTLMGEDLGPWHVQDVDFSASYLTLTRVFGKHRLSSRYEWFDLQPYNDPAGVTNQDKGNAYAVTWLYELNERVQLGTEFMQIRSTHCRTTSCFWVFNGLPRKTNESQLQFTVRWRFDSKGAAK